MPYQPRATFDNPYGPQVSFRTQDVLPPAALYISPEDRVTVWVLTDVAVQTISLQMRLLMPTGEIQLIPYQFAPQFTLTWYAAFEVSPWEGYVLGVMCWSSNPQRGQCFVSVQVMRSAPPDLTAAGVVLVQGYTNNIAVLSYPTSPLESTFSGAGAFLTIQQPNQTGVNLNFGPPQNTRWRLWSLVFSFTTSAAPGNRLVAVLTKDINSVPTGLWPSTFAQPPSTTYTYTFAPGATSSNAAPYVTIGAPAEVFVPAQSTLQTAIAGLDAADALFGIAARVEEWMGY